jgi:hypothetical protein
MDFSIIGQMPPIVLFLPGLLDPSTNSIRRRQTFTKVWGRGLGSTLLLLIFDTPRPLNCSNDPNATIKWLMLPTAKARCDHPDRQRPCATPRRSAGSGLPSDRETCAATAPWWSVMLPAVCTPFVPNDGGRH